MSTNSIKIQNVYYMLAYVFSLLNVRGFELVGQEDFENGAELCAAILIRGISSQIKRGLAKDYIPINEQLSTIKGKIDVSSSVRKNTLMKSQIACNHDEFSSNSYLNRILKTTLNILMKSDINKELKKQLNKLLIYFSDVEVLDIKSIKWNVQFNKNNRTYQLLVYICYLVIKGLIQTTKDGTIKLRSFFDDKNMNKLYEKFILEYYRKHYPELNASSTKINWNLDDEDDELLPEMLSDVMLTKGEKTLIIDAKYYSKIMIGHFDVKTIRSNHLYQIYAYVKNYDKQYTGNVSGMLLYAKTENDLDFKDKDYKVDGNTLSVRTLDLNCDFDEIKRQLNEIAECGLDF